MHFQLISWAGKQNKTKPTNKQKIPTLKKKKTFQKPKVRNLTQGITSEDFMTSPVLLTRVTAKMCARNLFLSCFSWSFKLLPVWSNPPNAPNLFCYNICTSATVKRCYCENHRCAHLRLFQDWSSAGSRKHIRSSDQHTKSFLLLRKTKIISTF